MKRSAIVITAVTAMLIPATLAVAQADETPVQEQARVAEGNEFSFEYGDSFLLRLSEQTQTQAGPFQGEGPMGSKDAPYKNGPNDCDGNCDGPNGPQGVGNTHGEQDGTGPIEGQGPFGPQNGTGPVGACVGDCPGPYGPLGDGNTNSNAAGPQDCTGPNADPPEDGTGNQFGAGQGDTATASQNGAGDQRGPGGNK